jgi:hypothetical protein
MIVTRLRLAFFASVGGSTTRNAIIDHTVAIVVFAITGLGFGINCADTGSPCVVVFADPCPKATHRVARKRLVGGSLLPIVARFGATGDTVSFA